MVTAHHLAVSLPRDLEGSFPKPSDDRVSGELVEGPSLVFFAVATPWHGTKVAGRHDRCKKGYFVKYILQRCLALWWLIFITMQSVKKVYYVRLVVVSAF